jgi:site-specific DNA-methyltransferase (adenine-specific)/modification methylase
MKPYYQDSAVTIFLGDCREIVPTLGHFDLLLCDPPYGIGYSHGGVGGCAAKSTDFGGVTVYGDDAPFNPLEWLVFPMVILWGGNHFASQLPDSKAWLVWDKRDGMKSNDQSDCEMAWSNIGGTARLHRQAWNGMITTGEQRGKSRVHPTQKPVELMTWCISLAGDVQTILDPFAGSCTTARAAKDLGRKCVCIEREERYCEIGAKRMAQEVFAL